MNHAAPLFLGLDASTTSVKAILFDASGAAVAAGRAGVSLRAPRPGWHEQSADDWWRAAGEAIRAAAGGVEAGRIQGMAMSIQRETFVVVDATGEPLMDALVWMDERARPLMPELEARLGRERVLRSTGKPFSANLTLAKLAWIRRERPEIAARAAGAWDVHAYLAARLVGEPVTSWACADPGGLFSMAQNAWDEELIRAVGWKPEQMPRALPPGTLAGRLTRAAAEHTGLCEGLPVFAGLGDGQSAGLGAGVLQPGEAVLNLGTAVVSGTCADRFITDPAFRTHYAGAPRRYDLETVLLGGTYTISWFLEKFAPGLGSAAARVEDYDAAAALIKSGAEGLLLVPYWNTALSPYYDASATGIVAGWRGIHTLAHLYRAILEGIALELRLQMEGIETALGQHSKRLIAVGGGSRSALWRQIIADVTGRPVLRCDETEASALGAAITAAWGSGAFASAVEAAGAMAGKAQDPLEGDEGRGAFYTRLYEEVYKPLFPAARAVVDRLAGLAEGPG